MAAPVAQHRPAAFRAGTAFGGAGPVRRCGADHADRRRAGSPEPGAARSGREPWSGGPGLSPVAALGFCDLLEPSPFSPLATDLAAARGPPQCRRDELTEGAPVAQIAGINLFLVLANAALAALHHSHVWLSYGPVIEHIVISPAQHQIHHSADPKHHDRNFGNSLAIWDWMFGTLYVIRDQETLVLGLSGPQEEPLMSQRLWPILCDPVRRMLKAGG
ncbi:MAG: hypothetical protein B7Z04_13515 [Rhodobacterales bacterium 32-66-9]|nr:MAG: hypothetical protein B7Z04_13515 [Rhodobacterales bacterium 32-66-9]